MLWSTHPRCGVSVGRDDAFDCHDAATTMRQAAHPREIVDQGVITSRNPGDLDAFSAKIIEEVKEGRHVQRSAG